jgi:hypothetical protein
MMGAMTMITTVRGIVRGGRVELPTDIQLDDGVRVLVTALPSDDSEFWMRSSQMSLDTIWNNEQDDVYAQLLKK